MTTPIVLTVKRSLVTFVNVMPKSQILHMRVDENLKNAIRQAARERGIDTSAFVSLVLTEWLTRNAQRRIDLSETPISANAIPKPDDHA